MGRVGWGMVGVSHPTPRSPRDLLLRVASAQKLYSGFTFRSDHCFKKKHQEPLVERFSAAVHLPPVSALIRLTLYRSACDRLGGVDVS